MVYLWKALLDNIRKVDPPSSITTKSIRFKKLLYNHYKLKLVSSFDTYHLGSWFRFVIVHYVVNLKIKLSMSMCGCLCYIYFMDVYFSSYVIGI